VIGGVLDKIPLIGAVAAGAIGGAVGGLMHLINKFDELGDKAERFGVSVDFLAAMRYAAEKAGAPVEALDAGLMTFSVNMGKLSANTGRFKKFLDLVSPALEEQLKKAKSNEAAFYLLAAAMDKLKDPAKRAALAAAAGLGPELAPLLAQGEAGVKQLAARYIELAGSQEDAAKKAGDVDDSMHDLHASVQGAEAAIVSGLAPAMRIIVDQLRDWFVAHRSDIAEWAKTLGEKIPGAFRAVVDWVGQAIEKLGKFFGILEDIYDKIKDITHANDAEYQAGKVTAMVPAEKAAAAAQVTWREDLRPGQAAPDGRRARRRVVPRRAVLRRDRRAQRRPARGRARVPAARQAVRRGPRQSRARTYRVRRLRARRRLPRASATRCSMRSRRLEGPASSCTRTTVCGRSACNHGARVTRGEGGIAMFSIEFTETPTQAVVPTP
jgi:hypothetical protein